jgi:hypothetical protein
MFKPLPLGDGGGESKEDRFISYTGKQIYEGKPAGVDVRITRGEGKRRVIPLILF